ncbi:MAG TPA: hypothetical protein VLZ75_05265 [Chitinophagales bacterium]|nr:hypothetical protein [Chitinophagales bacterium]
MKNLNLIIFQILFCSLIITGCKKNNMTEDEPTYVENENNNIPKDAPICIQNGIKHLLSVPVTNPPASIWQYDYNEQTVYYLPPQCCDMPSYVIDDECKIICSPGGDITGAGDGKCKDFIEKRKNEKLIWKDQRKWK